MTTLAAAAFEHDLATKKLRRDGRDPAEKLLRVTRVFLREVLPLPTEVVGGRLLVALHRGEIGETRNARGDWKRSPATETTQGAFHYLLTFGARDEEVERAVARRTREIRE